MTKFNSELAQWILDDIGEGIPYKIAAESNGISERLLYMWLDQGMKDLNEKTDSLHSAFLQSLRTIEKKRIRNALQNIHANEKGHRGYEWDMERSFWKYFSSHAQNIELNERVENLEKSKENK